MKFNQETLGTLNEHTGLVKLTSGTITTPVAFLDLALPAAYRRFRIEWQGVLFDTDHETLSFVVSQNGGSTFINDTTNQDSYFYNQAVSLNGILNQTPSFVQDQVIAFGFASDLVPAFPQSLFLDVLPGSASELFSVYGESSGVFTAIGVNYGFVTGTSGLWPTATITPTKARVNLLRFLPYGNGDSNPPTSGETITSGSYVLWGIG